RSADGVDPAVGPRRAGVVLGADHPPLFGADQAGDPVAGDVLLGPDIGAVLAHEAFAVVGQAVRAGAGRLQRGQPVATVDVHRHGDRRQPVHRVKSTVELGVPLTTPLVVVVRLGEQQFAQVV